MELDKYQPNPFSEKLGSMLKRIRTAAKMTLKDLSGALEVSVETITSFEKGTSLPSEEYMILFMQRFKVGPKKANEMIRLAGMAHAEDAVSEQNDKIQKTSQNNPTEQVIYTDMAQVVINNFGVVINFLQTTGPGDKPIVISRVGMSKEHAASVMELLSKTLQNTRDQSEEK